MEFQFDADQEHQLRAIAAVVGLFDGHVRPAEAFTLEAVSVRPNPSAIDWDRVRENLRHLQVRNGLPPDEALAFLEGDVEEEDGARPVRFANFTVEMETGTGKTYVYVRTALELHARYGFRKFIVVVPSVAVREGVLKTLQITDRHFRALYHNPPFRYYAYDSERLARVRSFAQSDGLELMVMTIQAFQSERTVLRQERDQLQGLRPIRLVQAAKPVLILDEPQNMESEDRIRALTDLDPLFALRYSATHRHTYNLVYRLTPLEAYRRGLVKRIEVAGLTESGVTRPYVELVEVRPGPRHLRARLRVHRFMASGVAALKTITVRSGDDLEARSGNPIYRDYKVDEVNAAFVSFTDGTVLHPGNALGPDREAIFRAQIRYTLETHILKQRRLKDLGVKVLSLFFVDRVKSYVGEDGREGLVRRLFREELDAMARDPRYADWRGCLPAWEARPLDPEAMQAAYFAQKVKRGGVAYFEEDSTREAREAFQQAYQLIMRDKERLLSLDEPVAFIFSHSALREGWDNPNIFQICTLNETASAIKKRQEIGRGVRLCVNQRGERLFEAHLNRLTVVANQSHEEYARQLQAEWLEDGTEGYRPVEAPQRPGERPKDTVRRTKDLTHPLFLELWERIKHRTRYRLRLDSDRLVREVVEELDRLAIPEASVVVGKVVMEADGGGLFPLVAVSTRDYAPASRPPMPNVLELAADLLRRSSPPIQVTRRTLFEVLRRTTNAGLMGNPYGFAQALARLVREKAADQLAGGICYEKTGEWYVAEQVFAEEFSAYVDRLRRRIEGRPLGKSLYEAVEVESEIEDAFVEQLERDARVLLYAKLPRAFAVPTPLGRYVPDWALVVEERDAHGAPAQRVYLVQETKMTQAVTALSPDEHRKVLCGRAHFEALSVRYAVGPHLDA